MRTAFMILAVLAVYAAAETLVIGEALAPSSDPLCH